MFAVNNNGMIIFHPRLKTVVSIPIQNRPIMGMQLPHINCFFTKYLATTLLAIRLSLFTQRHKLVDSSTVKNALR